MGTPKEAAGSNYLQKLTNLLPFFTLKSTIKNMRQTVIAVQSLSSQEVELNCITLDSDKR